MTPLRRQMLDELQLRNLSAYTRRAYVGAVEKFSKYLEKSPEKMGPEQVREYLLHLIRDKEALPNTVMVTRSGLRFLYVCTLKQSWF
jgi:integrase/recombinase XerD